MQKIFLSIVIVFIISVITISIFFIANNTELFGVETDNNKIESKSNFKLFSLSKHDLVEGFKSENEKIEYHNGQELYEIQFRYNGHQHRNYSNVYLYIKNHPTVDKATDELKSRKEEDYTVYKKVTEILKEIGEESYISQTNTSNFTLDIIYEVFGDYEKFEKVNHRTSTEIVFRISDITCYVSWDQKENFDYLFELAKIMEQRIYESNH